jgi:diguanylate cyclase (GGDEF)-like protein
MQETVNYMTKDRGNYKEQLDSLIRVAKHNERKQANFQDYELKLLNCSNLNELLTLILSEHKERFQLTEVTLLLHDPEYDFQRLIESFPHNQNWKNRLLFTESLTMLSQYFTYQRKPRLTTYSIHQHKQLFPNCENLRSVALLPMIRHNKLIGCMNLGSRDPDRFQANIGTLFLQHMAAVVSACIENARLTEHIKQVGLKDPLTGVNNRRFFDQRVEEEVNRALRHKQPLSCLFIDLDHFKRINDSYGHQAGDAVLKQTADILKDSSRSSDVVARYGGEEFVILLANTKASDALDFAERLRERIAATSFAITETKSLNVTLSAGLATLTNNSESQTSVELIKAADQAVYAAKLSGRNRVHQV